MNWDSKRTWRGLMTLLLALGVAWTALSRAPEQVAVAQNGGPPSPQTGFTAPDFTLDILGGGTVSLSDLRGQAVLVNFWATWCPPCRAEMPAIQRVYDRYRDQGFTVLAVDLQEDDAQVAGFAEEMGLTFPILMDRDGSVFARYRVMGLPSTFFVDQNGIIQEVTVGGPMTEAFIESQVTNLLTTSEGDE
jgi:peroxiredoxin